MILYLIILFFLAMLETTLINLNLVLYTIIAITLLNNDQSTIIVAFIAGLFLGILSGSNLGLYCLLFIVISQLLKLYKNTAFYGNNFFLIPLVIICLIVYKIALLLILKQSFAIQTVLIETIVFLVIYYLSKLLTSQISTPSELKLKIR